MRLRQRIRRLGVGAWSGWPAEVYQRPRFQQRLRAVQEQLSESLNSTPAGPLRIISMCAGDGRDVIDVLSSHPRRHDVKACLVELDRKSVEAGIQSAKRAGLEGCVSFLNEDATDFVTYQQIAPADIVLVCGVWGHVPVEERARLVHALGMLCKPGGVAIWTCGVLKNLARSQEIRSQFYSQGWEEICFTLTPEKTWVVATHRYVGPAIGLPVSGRLFRFQRGIGR